MARAQQQIQNTQNKCLNSRGRGLAGMTAGLLAVGEALLDANMLQNLIADLLHNLGTGVIRLVNSVPKAHQPESN